MTRTPASPDDPTWIRVLEPDGGADPDGAVSFAVKDCIDVAGTITTAGSPAVAEAAEAAVEDAACLSGFRRAGAVLVGKTNLHELCFGSSGVNPHHGTPVNPLDPRRIPGGSSSGSAVAVATGAVDFAIGTDTTGSIRTPAACCGIVGLKPTYGVVPVEGSRPLAPSLDTIGVMARSVADVAAAAALLDDRLVAGDLEAEPRAARLRLPGTDPTVDAAIESVLIDAGIEVSTVDLPSWDAATSAAIAILYAEALLVNEDIWRGHRDRLGSDVQERFVMAEQLDPDEVAAARALQGPWAEAVDAVVEEHGVLITPTMLGYPARVGEHAVPPNPAAPAISLSGHPTVTLPVPSGGLLPASLQVIGPHRGETRALAFAARLEAAIALR